MAGNTDTLNVGAGLTVDVAFTGGVPMIGGTDGAPCWIIGNRVVVVDPTRLNEETQTVRDLSDGIMASVQNRLTQTGGAGGAQSSTNAFGGLSGAAHAGNARMQASLPHERRLARGGIFRIRLTGGIEGWTDFGGSDADLAILRQALSLDSTSGTDLGFPAGFSDEYEPREGFVSFFNAKVLIELDGDVRASGQAGLKMRF